MKMVVWVLAGFLFLSGLYWTADSLLSGSDTAAEKLANNTAGEDASGVGLSQGSKPAAKKVVDAEEWQSIKDSFNRAEIEGFIDRFPNSNFRKFAESRLRDIIGSEESEAVSGDVVAAAEPDADTSKVADAEETVADAVEASVVADSSGTTPVAENEDSGEELTPLPDGTQRVASVEDQLTTGTVDDERMAYSIVSDSQLVRELQYQLERVGCNPGVIDGRWGSNGRKALETFNKYAALTLDVNEPSRNTINAVKAKEGVICPEVDQVEAVAPVHSVGDDPETRRKQAAERKRKLKLKRARQKRAAAAKKKKKAAQYKKRNNACSRCQSEYGGYNARKAAMCQHVC